MRSANLGGPGGQGGILLKIKTLSSLPVGSTVNTGAQLFFDYDVVTSPINLGTNNASTTFQNLSSSITSYDASISMYPNPTHSILFIEGSEVVKTVELYDVFGRLLQTNINSTEKTSIDLSNRETGIYFLKVTTDKGQKVEKIMKK